ncbi:MAG TPA: DUF1634 domain-containing protein [Terriglobales bacterium]|nr:DUF1634 domain-containing protein [Terriglobales bacterium]
MPRNWSDQNIEDVVGNLLRAGVTLSATVVFGGGLVYLIGHGRAAVDYRLFRGEPPELRSLSGILHNAFSRHGLGIIQLGLVLLILTPVARVAFSIWAFAAERDRMYVMFTGIVLVILLYSLLGSGSAF